MVHSIASGLKKLQRQYELFVVSLPSEVKELATISDCVSVMDDLFQELLAASAKLKSNKVKGRLRMEKSEAFLHKAAESLMSDRRRTSDPISFTNDAIGICLTTQQYVLNSRDDVKTCFHSILQLPKVERMKSIASMGAHLQDIGKLIGILSSLAGAGTIESLCSDLRFKMIDLLSVSRVTLFLYNKEHNTLYGTDKTGLKLKLSLDSGVTGFAARMGMTIMSNDLSTSVFFDPSADETIVEKTRNILCIPIKDMAEDTLIGVLQLCNKTKNFDNHDEFLVTLISTQLRIIIQNILQKEKLNEKIAQCNALLEMSRTVTSKLDTNQVIDSILTTVKQLVRADRGSIFQVDHDKKEIKTLIKGKPISVAWEQGVVGRVVSTGNSINVHNTKDVDFWDPSVDKQTNYHTQSILAVPILDDTPSDKVVGVIQMINKQPKNGEECFSDEDMDLLESFSHFASISLKNCRLYGNSLRKERVAVKLLNAFKELSGTLRLEDLLSSMTNKARTLLHADRGTVFLVDSEKNELWSTVVDGLDEIRVPIGKGIAGHVAATGETLNIPDVYRDTRFYSGVDEQSGYQTKSILCVPIFNASQIVIGVTQMINKDKGANSFTVDDEELLCRFAQDASIFIQNSKMYEHAKANEMRAAKEVKETTNASVDRETAAFMNIISNRALDLTHASSCTLYLLSADQENFVAVNSNSSPIPVSFIQSSLQNDDELIIKNQEDNVHTIYYRILHRGTAVAILQIINLEKSFDDCSSTVFREIGTVATLVMNKAFYLEDIQEYEKKLNSDSKTLLATYDAIKSSRLYQITQKKQTFLQCVLSSVKHLVFTIDCFGFLDQSNELFEDYGLSKQLLASFPCTEWATHSNPRNHKFFDDVVTCHTFCDANRNQIIHFYGPFSEKILRYTILPWRVSVHGATSNEGTIVIVDDVTPSHKFNLTLCSFEACSRGLVYPNFDVKVQVNSLLRRIQEIFAASRVLVFTGTSTHTMALKYHLVEEDTEIPENYRYICQYDKGIIAQAIKTKELVCCHSSSTNTKIEVSNLKLHGSPNANTHVHMFTMCIALKASSSICGVLYIDGIPSVSLLDSDKQITRTISSILTCYIGYDKKIGTESLRRNSADNYQKFVNEELEKMRLRVAESEKVKSAFLMNMSHELRTPLNAIIGTAELLMGTNLNDQQLQFMNNIATSSSSLLGIINDILDYTKVGAGDIRLDSKAFDLRVTLEDTIAMFSESNEERDIEICLDMAPTVTTFLIGDPHRVRQLFSALLSNACKFSHPHSTVMVHVHCDSFKSGESSDIQCFHFKIIDTGVGMSREAQEKLFKPFSQADSSTTRRYEGTGLGLMICKHLVELMQGELFIHSVPDLGTEVSFQCEFQTQEKSTLYTSLPDYSLLHSKRALIISAKASKTILQSILEFVSMYVECLHSISDLKAKLDSHTDLTSLQVSNCSPISYLIVDREFLRDPSFPSLVSTMLENKNEKYKLEQNHTQIALSKKLSSLQNSAEALRSIVIPVKLQQVFTCLLVTKPKYATPPSGDCSEDAVGASHKDKSNFLTLLVDDNRMNRVVIKKQLERVGIIPDIAENGMVAVEKFKTNRYDLILMDCHMPVMDGYTATKEIRSLEVGSDSRVIIVALTADALTGTRDQCLSVGMDDYYTKPLRHKDFVEIQLKYAT